MKLECFCNTVNGCNFVCRDSEGNRAKRHQVDECVFSLEDFAGFAEAIKYLTSHPGVDCVIPSRDVSNGIYRLSVKTFSTTCASQLCYHLFLEG